MLRKMLIELYLVPALRDFHYYRGLKAPTFKSASEVPRALFFLPVCFGLAAAMCSRIPSPCYR